MWQQTHVPDNAAQGENDSRGECIFCNSRTEKPSLRRELWEQALKTGCVTRPEGSTQCSYSEKNTATKSPFDKGTGICSVMSKEVNYNVSRHQKLFKYVSDSGPSKIVHTIKNPIFHSQIHLLTFKNIPPACPHLEQSSSATTQLLQLNLLRFFYRSIESYQAKRTLLRAQKEEAKQ